MWSPAAGPSSGLLLSLSLSLPLRSHPAELQVSASEHSYQTSSNIWKDLEVAARFGIIAVLRPKRSYLRGLVGPEADLGDPPEPCARQNDT